MRTGWPGSSRVSGPSASLSGQEIVTGKPDRPALQQCGEIRAEARDVDRRDRFVIGPAVLSERRPVAVQEIIVQRNHQGPEPVHPELDVQPLGERGLARRGGARDEYDPFAAAVDAVGQEGDLLSRAGFPRS